MTRQLARRGLCRLDLLDRGAAPVAASIVLESAEALWLWRAAGAPGLGRGADRIVAAAAARARRAGKRLTFVMLATTPRGKAIRAREYEEMGRAAGFETITNSSVLPSSRPSHATGASRLRGR